MKNTFKTLICALALSTTVAFAGNEKEAAKPTTFATGVYTSLDGKLTVNVVKKSRIPTTVLIRNAAGDILTREFISKKQLKQSYKFDVSDLREGEYTVEVVGNGEKEVKSFTITSRILVTKRTLTVE
ncbi:hypothetical protein [Telluribacter sp.]|jgi:hypothetical protein|uniref:hypothetical protein n=1 Tax=Telluribacter sp. TaxID=1978767 RepID=UPI002E0D7FF0|nr:hypothetical protein [Telluribacter sp.]